MPIDEEFFKIFQLKTKIPSAELRQFVKYAEIVYETLNSSNFQVGVSMLPKFHFFFQRLTRKNNNIVPNLAGNSNIPSTEKGVEPVRILYLINRILTR